MANKTLSNQKDLKVAKSVALPIWMWEIIDGKGNRSAFVFKKLERTLKRPEQLDD